MKEIITETLKGLSISEYAKINTDTGRDFIADKLLEVFKDNHIVFYTNLEAHRRENPIDEVERGL
jgi:hypothetical protein